MLKSSCFPLEDFENYGVHLSNCLKLFAVLMDTKFELLYQMCLVNICRRLFNPFWLHRASSIRLHVLRYHIEICELCVHTVYL
jgi:hypothetical protein